MNDAKRTAIKYQDCDGCKHLETVPVSNIYSPDRKIHWHHCKHPQLVGARFLGFFPIVDPIECPLSETAGTSAQPKTETD